MPRKRKIGITIEARLASTRLPGKILKPLHGKPMLARMIERLKRVQLAETIVLATTDQPQDQPVADLAKQLGIGYYQGSSEDVLDRVLKAAQKYDIDLIVETCGDCPLIDPGILDMQIRAFLDNDVDYVGCHLVKTYPLGVDAKLFTTKTLEEVAGLTSAPPDRENVSLYIYEHPQRYKLLNIEAKGKYRRPDLRLVVDHQEDFNLVEIVYSELYDRNPGFGLGEIISLFDRKPDLAQLNRNVVNIKVAGRK